MGKLYNINPGDIFGRLTVVGKVDDAIDPNSKKHMSRYLCRCSCPEHNTIIVKGKNLTSGCTKSCGCLLRENASVLRSGKKAIHPDYTPANVNPGIIYAYRTMLYDARNGVGNLYNNPIPVYGDWSNVKSFYDSVYSTYEPGCKLKRINKDIGFRPENCYWGSTGYTELDTVNDSLIEYNGYTLTVSEWNRVLGYPENTIANRILQGYSNTDAIIGKQENIRNINAVYFVNSYGRPLNNDAVNEMNY